jgi:hypothetical protein
MDSMGSAAEKLNDSSAESPTGKSCGIGLPLETSLSRLFELSALCGSGQPAPHYSRMKIRDAKVDDACAAAQVLRRSITDLCAADHGNDPAILAQWLVTPKAPPLTRSCG